MEIIHKVTEITTASTQIVQQNKFKTMSLRDKRFDGAEDYNYELVDPIQRLLEDIERKIAVVKELIKER